MGDDTATSPAPRNPSEPDYPKGRVRMPLDCCNCGWPITAEEHQGEGVYVRQDGPAVDEWRRLEAKVRCLEAQLAGALKGEAELLRLREEVGRG